jgi:hypothetical protein
LFLQNPLGVKVKPLSPQIRFRQAKNSLAHLGIYSAGQGFPP